MLRVLHVLPSISPARGGPSEAIRQMEAACSGQILFAIATTDDDGPGRRYSSRSNYATVGAARVHIFERTSESYTTSVKLARWLFREVRNYDVVHVHYVFTFASTVAMLAARRAGVPYIVRPLGTLSPYGIQRRRPVLKSFHLRFVERPLLERAAAVHCTSRQEQAEIESLHIKTATHVIPLAAPVDEHTSRDLTASSTPNVLFLSRLDPKKNVEGLIDAFDRLAPTFPCLRLLIAGDGDPAYVASLQARANALEIRDRVEWLGDVRGLQKRRLLREASVFVLPSFAENFGIAVAEALGVGVPCVVGRGVAIAAQVEAAGAGFAVDPDAASISMAIERVLSPAADSATMSTQAKSLAEREFSLEALGTRLQALYAAVAKKI